MPEFAHLYRGRAGQMAVMAEFLDRGYNVAVPEVDIGNDIFVVHDRSGVYRRIQVKTSYAKPTTKGTSARYSLRRDKLVRPSAPETLYVFVRRLEDRWLDYILITREELHAYHKTSDMGSVSKKGIVILNIKSEPEMTICSGVDLSRHVNDWSAWPQI